MKKRRKKKYNIVLIVVIGLIIFAVCGFSYKKYSFRQNITSNIGGIVCWGDSLTAGAGGYGTTYPSVLEKLISDNIGNIPVYNLGVGGETTRQIRVRNGSLVLTVKYDITIPSGTEPVQVELVLPEGDNANILRQGNAGIEEVTIGSVKGYLTIDQTDYTSDVYTYYFTRESAGKEANISAGTEVKVTSSLIYKNCLPVIFMGTNGGWTTPEELIEQIDSIVEGQYEMGRERYLVLGLTTGTSEDNEELEKAMEEYYGERYINLREYLSTQALSDAGIEPTDADNEYMAVGSVPPSIRSDDIHLNETGYELVGQLVYDRMVELGYFEYKIKVK